MARLEISLHEIRVRLVGLGRRRAYLGSVKHLRSVEPRGRPTTSVYNASHQIAWRHGVPMPEIPRTRRMQFINVFPVVLSLSEQCEQVEPAPSEPAVNHSPV
jgi:hypothetical protein